jgi:hypothetical protein
VLLLPVVLLWWCCGDGGGGGGDGDFCFRCCCQMLLWMSEYIFVAATFGVVCGATLSYLLALSLFIMAAMVYIQITITTIDFWFTGGAWFFIILVMLIPMIRILRYVLSSSSHNSV